MNTKKVFKCSSCDEANPDNFHEKPNRRGKDYTCKKCRRNRYYKKRYGDIICPFCGENYCKKNYCKSCLAQSNLKECNKCFDLLTPNDFYPNRSRCKKCYINAINVDLKKTNQNFINPK